MNRRRFLTITAAVLCAQPAAASPAMWKGRALGADAQTSFEHAEPRFIPIGEYWYNWARGSYNGIQVFLERYVWPPLWDPGLLTVVQWPVWVVSGPLGIILFVLGYAKR